MKDSKVKKIVTAILVFIIGVAGVTLRSYFRNPEKFKNTEFSQTDTITHKDISYSILDITIDEKYNTLYASDGNEFVIVTIKMENDSSLEINVNDDEWKMTGTSPVTGKEITYTPVFEEKEKIVLPDETKEVTIAFEQPIDATPTKLKFMKNGNDYRGNTFIFLLEEGK